MNLEIKPSTEPTHIIGAIYDNKAGILWQPQLFRSKADFVRACQTGAKDPSTMLHKFPSDYELMVVGAWSESFGIVPEVAQQRLGTVLDLCPLS